VLVDAIEYLRQGGWIMIPLGVCSLVMWMLITERIWAYRRLTGGDLDLQDAVRLLEEAGPAPGNPGLCARLLLAFKSERTGDAHLDRQILRACVRRLAPGLQRYLAVIGVLAAVAPLLGLLGTVIGMVQTFQVIAIFGTGNAQALAGGVSVALVTTQSGLLVAIPGLFMSGALERRAAKLRMRLDETATVLERHLPREAP